MKKIIIPISTLFVVGLSHAQTLNLSTNENYVYSKTYLDYDSNNQPTKTSETVQYLDGLSRPKQVVNIKASPLQRDVVSHITYDGFGRQALDYLPVPQNGTANGAIVTNPLANALNTPYGSEKIYAEKAFENSPLDRVLEQKQVGTAWNDKPVKFDYDANIAGEVKKFTTTTTWENNATKSIAFNGGTYGTAQLYKNTVTDEDGNKTIEFKNGQGQLLLVRKVLSATENADTYYVYNEYNQLAFVVPPKAIQDLEDQGFADGEEMYSGVLSHLCYEYRYDGRNRLVEKKLPGKGWEYMVYDKADRLVATQDANQEPLKKWLFTKYDKFGRVLYTGISIDNGDRNAVQTWITNTYGINTETAGTYSQSGLQIHYGNTAYPQNIESILSVNYYDSYLPGDPFPTMVYDQVVLPSNVQQYGVSTKGLPVSSFVKNIEDDNWTKTYMYYDLKGRLIREYSQNHLGGYTNIEKRLDFSGNPNIILTQHKRLVTDTERVITENFTYDHQNRLLTHTHQVDNNPLEYLAQNEYNELSQLKNKKVGGASLGSGLQQVDYAYNIRGWMTQINNPNDLSGGDLFGYEIKYNNPENTSLSTGRFNGNIAEIDWKTSTNPNDNKRRYSYTYDGLNRLQQGIYSEPGSSLINNDNYNEQLTYDLNGNIATLKRFSKPSSGTTAEKIDDLIYNYTGNRLDKITLPAGVANNFSGYNALQNVFTYDANGNMTKHLDKDITSIVYNYLNLPSNISTGIGKIKSLTTYLYRADGMKLKKSVSSNLATGSTKEIDYLDGFQYSFYGGAIVAPNSSGLQFVPTSEGYFDFVKNKYIYNYSDHLGNTRLSYFHNGSSIEVLEESNYYPFGLKHEGYNALAGNPSYQYKYNGKELQETGMYDYGARFYIPDIGRWGVVDPLAEKMTRHSPYNYAFNNPIRFIDPDGRQGTDWVQRGSQVFFDDKVKSQADAVATYGETAQHLGEGSTLTTKVSGEVTSQYTFHNNGTVSSDLGPLDNRFDHTTQGGTTIMASNSTGGYGALNYGTILGGIATERAPGSFRLTNGLANGSAFSPKYYGSGWAGGSRARISTYNIGKIGTGIGYVAAGAGLLIDGIGVYNYSQNPNAPDAVTPTKAATNTGMSAWGILGGPYGVMVSAAYGGMETLYPGGVEGAMNDNAKFQSELDNGVNKAGPNRVYIIPRGPK